MEDYSKGIFTSSGVNVLIPTGKVKMTADELKIQKAEFPSSRATQKDGGFTAGGDTYIRERRIERRLERSLRSDVYSRAMFWGNLMEKVCFDILPMDYKLVSQEGKLHPEHKDFWGGTPDLIIPDLLISEIKCYQLKGFAEYTDMILEGSVELFKEKYAQEYWQIVSNAIICDVEYGEAISYMPYKAELEQIKHDIENTNLLERWNFEPWQARFILEDKISNLSYLNEGGYYKNLNIFRFKVPQEDKDYLTSRILEASQLLK
jgi:hypothetical protein